MFVLCTSACGLLPAYSVLAASLVGQWTFNETAVDTTGNGNDVVLVGDPSFVSTGPTNLGLSLNPAAGQYVDYGSSQLFNITGAFSLESWVTVRSLPAAGGEPLIFGKDHTLFGTTMYANGNSYSYVGGGALAVAVPLPLNQRLHLVETWDGATIRVYQNGALAGTLSSSTAPNSNGGNSLLSGKPGPSDGSGFLDAILDETRIYTGPLSAAEVSANYSAGPTQIIPQWVAQSGDWNTSSNWVGGVPNSIDAIANFAGAISSPSTVFTDVPVIVGKLRFDNANTYVLSGTSSLTVQSSIVPAIVEVLSGSHAINLPLGFASNTNLTIASGSTLTIGNSTVIKAGSAVVASGNLRIAAPLTIEAGGSLFVGLGMTSLGSVPMLGPSAKVQVGNGQLLIDYHGQTGVASQIQTLLATGYHNGAWDGSGITISPAIGNVGLAWRDDTANEMIQIQRALYGDANIDGAVNSIDFGALLQNYGLSTGAGWTQGDFNYDLKVNTLDFNLLAANFGGSFPVSASTAVVPEPTSVSLVCLMVVGFRRRCKGE